MMVLAAWEFLGLTARLGPRQELVARTDDANDLLARVPIAEPSFVPSVIADVDAIEQRLEPGSGAMAVARTVVAAVIVVAHPTAAGEALAVAVRAKVRIV